MKSEILKLAKELIKIPSETRHKSELQKITKFAKEYLASENVFIKVEEINGYPSIIATIGKETKNPEFLLNGHLDVVPAEPEQYTPYVKDGKLYGRGAGDMKGPNAAMMAVFKYFSTQENPPDLGIMLNTDEEIGGLSGVYPLLNEYGYSTKTVFIPDSGTGMDDVVVSQKGIAQIKVWANGKSAHGSRPFLGENAIEKLTARFQELRKVVPHISEPIWQSTMNLGIINGGNAVNKIPDYAEMYLDIRLVNENDRKEFLKEIKNIFKEDYELILDSPCYNQDQDCPYFKKYLESLNDKIAKSNIVREEASSDVRHFAEKGISAIMTGVKKENTHGLNEWCDIKELELMYDVLVDFIV